MANIVKDLSASIIDDPDVQYRDVKLEETASTDDLVNADAVINSVTNLFTWEPNSRVRNPEFGLNLRKFVYEPLTDTTASRISQEIRDAFERFEPRVKIEDIIITDDDDHTFSVELQYTIPMLPDVGTKKISHRISGSD